MVCANSSLSVRRDEFVSAVPSLTAGPARPDGDACRPTHKRARHCCRALDLASAAELAPPLPPSPSPSPPPPQAPLPPPPPPEDSLAAAPELTLALPSARARNPLLLLAPMLTRIREPAAAPALGLALALELGPYRVA